MKFRSFKYSYHDSDLLSFNLGNPRELTFEFAVNPVHNRSAPPSTSVHLFDVENHDDVAAFFRGLPRPSGPESRCAEVIDLRYLGKGPNWVVLDLAGRGHIEIQARRVTEL